MENDDTGASDGESMQVPKTRETHDISNGVAGWEEPPIVCAKLLIEPLFGRGFPRTPLLIGTPEPPPNAHIAPLLAKDHIIISTS
jgi:hypothetical protein